MEAVSLVAEEQKKWSVYGHLFHCHLSMRARAHDEHAPFMSPLKHLSLGMRTMKINPSVCVHGDPAPSGALTQWLGISLTIFESDNILDSQRFAGPNTRRSVITVMEVFDPKRDGGQSVTQDVAHPLNATFADMRHQTLYHSSRRIAPVPIDHILKDVCQPNSHTNQASLPPGYCTPDRP